MTASNVHKVNKKVSAKSQPEIENYAALSSFFDFENAMLQRNIGLFDQKSAVLLACNLAVTLYLFNGLNDQNAVASIGSAGFMRDFFTYTSIFLFVLSSFFTFIAVRPRITKSEDVVFWGSQAFDQNLDHYIERVKTLEKRDLLEQRLKTSYVLAGICKQKFRWLQRAFLTAIIAFIALILARSLHLLFL